MTTLKATYTKNVKADLKKIFSYKNDHQIPKLEKIIISCGLGLLATQNKDYLYQATQEIRLISGQQPIVTKAKKSISGFKIRKGMDLGLMVTLRKQKMYYFLDKFINLVLPEIKDFNGLNKDMINKKGSFNMGIIKQDVFPEIDYEDKALERGYNINIVTTSKSKEETLALLKEFGFPFFKNKI